jgi:uncharacterized protein YjiS (DUF1127 family)
VFGMVRHIHCPSVTNPARRVACFVRKWRLGRARRRDLALSMDGFRALSDVELADIGVERAEIEAATVNGQITRRAGT